MLFKANTVHFSTTMCLMNKLRQEETFCDITLTVGPDQIQAHRCVLAAGSPYFQSLFLGHFTEASMKCIDLSEVTDDVNALETIINFIYTGEIDISIENLGVIVKLSSFFLVGTLRDFCIEFMSRTLFLKTCLRYYLYAVDHGLSDIEAKTTQMVQSRFHDFLIFEEDTLKMSPDELLYITQKNILEHCTSTSVIAFIARWVEKGLTEKHVSVGSEALDIVNSKGNIASEMSKMSVQNAFDRVKAVLEEHKVCGCDKFLKKFRQIVTRLSTQTTKESKSYNLRTQQSVSGTSQCEVGTEVVIITLSPRPCVIDTFNTKERPHLGPVNYTEPIMDMCVYVPRTKCWFHVQELNDDGVPSLLLDDFLTGQWRFQTLHDDLACINHCGENMGLYNIRSNTWSNLAIGDHIDNELEHLEILNDICIASASDTGIYLVGKVRVFQDEDYEIPRGMYFIGFKLMDNLQTLHRIFRTALIDLSISNFLGIPELCAKISKLSNEMLVVHSQDEHNIAFVVNLNEVDKVPCTLLTTIDNSEIFRGVRIIEGKNQMFVVSDGTQNSGGRVKVIFEYKLNSCKLTEVKTAEKSIHQIGDGSQHLEDDSYPCLTETSANYGESCWYLEGNRKNVSFLTEVTVNRNKAPVTRQHTPPPFSCFVGAFATRIDLETLEKFRPISKFLHLLKSDLSYINTDM